MTYFLKNVTTISIIVLCKIAFIIVYQQKYTPNCLCQRNSIWPWPFRNLRSGVPTFAGFNCHIYKWLWPICRKLTLHWQLLLQRLLKLRQLFGWYKFAYIYGVRPGYHLAGRHATGTIGHYYVQAHTDGYYTRSTLKHAAVSLGIPAQADLF